MIVIGILNLSVKGRGRGAALEKKSRPKSLLKVPKHKPQKNGPDIAFEVSRKFLILSINFYPFLMISTSNVLITSIEKESNKP